MKKGIRFEKHVQKSTFHNPMLRNELTTQEITIRRDPLTGCQSAFNPSLEDKVAVFFGPTDQALIDRLARESQGRCFLCGDNWKLATPKYPKELVPDGRIQVGEAVLFPNLFPVAHVHAVIRVGDKHYVRLGDFDPAMILEAFQAPLRVEGREMQITTSIGLAFYPRDGADLTELLKKADVALYGAKDRGRNSLLSFEPGDAEEEPRVQSRILGGIHG